MHEHDAREPIGAVLIDVRGDVDDAARRHDNDDAGQLALHEQLAESPCERGSIAIARWVLPNASS